MKESLGRYQDAKQIYQVYQEGRPLSEETVSLVLQQSIKRNDRIACRKIHSLLISDCVQSDSLLQSYLIRFFCSAGNMLEANLLFVAVSEPNIFVWHAVIAGHFMHGLPERAIELFYFMQEQLVSPGRCTFLVILKVCSCMEDLRQGQMVHKQIISLGFEVEIAVTSSLIDMYGKCGIVDEAYQLFKKLKNKDMICWSTMMAVFCQNDEGLFAFELFSEFEEQGLKADRALFLSILSACADAEAVKQGRYVHDQIIKGMIDSDCMLCSSLIDMYAKCGYLEDGQKLFDLMTNPDVISWNTLIAGYSQHGHWPRAMELFNKMQLTGTEPDDIIINSILRGSQDLGCIKNTFLLHESLLLSGLDSNSVLQDMLIGTYISFGALKDGYKLFQLMVERSSSAWRTIMAGYLQHADGNLALELSERAILENNKPDALLLVCRLKACSKLQNLWQGKSLHARVVLSDMQRVLAVANALIEVYMKCHCAEMAQQVFESLPERDLVTWNSMIDGYGYNKQELTGSKLLEEMQMEGFAPDDFTYASLMKHSGSSGNIILARFIHQLIVAFGFETDAFLAGIIIDTYAECKSLEDANDVFEKLPSKSIACWNTMICRHVQLRNGLQALRLFEHMQEAQIGADKVTYLSILRICSMLLDGMWQQVLAIHDLLLRGSLESDLYLGTTLLDAYVKSMDVKGARKVFDTIPNRNVVTWGSMIGGYVHHGQGSSALDLIGLMVSEGLKPEKSTFLVAMKACVCTGAVEQGKVMHDWIVKDALEQDLDICSAVISFYGKCGSFQDAITVFRSLRCQDSICWNALLSAYANHGRDSAEQVLDELKEYGNPVNDNYTNVLTALSHTGLVEEGAECFKGIDFSQVTLLQYTCLIDLFGRAGLMEEAVEVFQTMPNLPDVAVWLIFLTACKMYGNSQLGKDCFNELCGLNIRIAAGYILISDIYADATTRDCQGVGLVMQSGQSSHSVDNQTV